MKNGRLEIQDLAFSYPEYSQYVKSSILNGLSLETAPGEIVVIYGRAESGKSTLALILSALVPLHSGGKVSGEALLDGIDLLETEPFELTERCGIVFQDPEKQTVTTDCFDEAAFALESLGIPENEIIRRVEHAFDRLGISHLLTAATSETSGGEKKRLALAGLAAVAPDLWILDETVEELDNPSRIELIRLLRDSGKTVIIFSSKHYEIFDLADGFYVLENGRLTERNSYPINPGMRTALVNAGIIPSFGRKRSGDNRSMQFDGTAGNRVILEASELTYKYSGGAFSLGIDRFILYEGETVAIVGRNGCGKSTLAKLLCGLLKPETGGITAFPEPEESRNEPAFLNSFCGYMFQNPDYQIFLPTVSEELSWGLKEAGYSSSVIDARVSKAIDEFKLPGASAPPALMSFSARKRLQAAVYYLLKRPVFILDEADTGMSYIDFTDLISRLKHVSRGQIIITHNLELASAISDRVLGMSGGRIFSIAESSPEKLNDWLTESETGGFPGQGSIK